MNTNQIIHADATETLRTFPDNAIDLVVTDPPYLCRYKDRSGRTLANDDAPEAVLPAFAEIYRVMRPHSYCILFCGWTAIGQFAQTWDSAGFRTLGHIVWPKRYSSSARFLQYQHESAWLLAKGHPRAPQRPLPDVQQWIYSGNRSHPTEKAVQIIKPLIESFSEVGDVVLDPFLGSGTTAVAAALTRRSYIGIELEERYCELARNRLAGVRRYQDMQQPEAFGDALATYAAPKASRPCERAA